MRSITILGANLLEHKDDIAKMTKNIYIEGDEAMTVSDGSHTIDELYEHRYELWIALCKRIAKESEYAEFMYNPDVWRTDRHEDGELAFGGGWFLLGINKEKGKQITYHLPIDKWKDTEFAETLEKAPEFDGHTSADVLGRLQLL